MKQILKIFNRSKKSAPTEAAPEYNFFKQGPKADASPYCTRLLRDRDYNPSSTLHIHLCPNTTEFKCFDTFRTLSHDSITDFFEALKNMRSTATIYTQNAVYGQVPNAIHLDRTVNEAGETEKIKISNSFWCRPSDVDNETIQLVQKILDCWNAKIDFRTMVKNWQERYERLEKDGNSYPAVKISI